MTRKWRDSTAGEHAETGVGGGELTDAMLSAEQRQGAWGPAESDTLASSLDWAAWTARRLTMCPCRWRSGAGHYLVTPGWTMTTIGDNASRSRTESAATTARVGP